VLSAKEVGALHKRERWFLLGFNGSHAGKLGRCPGDREDLRPEKQNPSPQDSRDVCNEGLSDTQSKGLSRQRQQSRHGEKIPFPCLDYDTREWQEAVRGVCRTADGVFDYVAKIRSLGNSVVPIQVREAFKMLMGAI